MSCTRLAGHRPLLLSLLFLAVAACAGTAPAPTAPRAGGGDVPRAQIEAAQRAWCDGLIEIGSVSARGGDVKAAAAKMLSTIYAYDEGTVLFKPTLAFGEHTFRPTKEGAVSYFVAGDSRYPHDHGFALKQWVKCEPAIAGVLSVGDVAIAMGKIALESARGDKVTVDKTFAYHRGADGTLKIIAHHSSLPFEPKPE